MISDVLTSTSSGIFSGTIISQMSSDSITDVRVDEDNDLNEEQQLEAQRSMRAFLQGGKLLFAEFRLILPVLGVLGKPALSTTWKWTLGLTTYILPHIICMYAFSSQAHPLLRSIANLTHVHLEKVAFVVSIVSLGVLAAHGQALYVGVAVGFVAVQFAVTYLKNYQGPLASLSAVINSISTILFQAATIFQGGWFPAVCVGAYYLDKLLWRWTPTSIKEGVVEKERQALVVDKSDWEHPFQLREIDPIKAIMGFNHYLEDLELSLDSRNQRFLKEDVSSEKIIELRKAIEEFREQQWQRINDEIAEASLSKEEAEERYKQAKEEPNLNHLGHMKEAVREGMLAKDFVKIKLQLLSMRVAELHGILSYPVYLFAHFVHSLKQTCNVQSVEMHTRLLIQFAIAADYGWSSKSMVALFDVFQTLVNPEKPLAANEKITLVLQLEREAFFRSVCQNSIRAWSESNPTSYEIHEKLFPKNIIRRKIGLFTKNLSEPWGFYTYFNRQGIQEVINQFYSMYDNERIKHVLHWSSRYGYISKDEQREWLKLHSLSK